MDKTNQRSGRRDDGEVGSRQSAVGSWQSAVGSRQSGVGKIKRCRNNYSLLSVNFSPTTFHYSLLFLLLFFPFSTANAQPVLFSAIQGQVTDAQTQSPLVGATVILVASDPLQGTTTGNDGRFILSKVPIGTAQVKVTYVGYLPFVSEVLTINSGKVTEVSIILQETVVTGKEVEIRGDYQKYGAINKMASVSVRSFSVDETFRFPGSYNDPARMAASFAGVTSGIDNRNDIIVRGNSPTGIQWRLDDMEIPNPNHFAAVGTTGGPVTVLNNNLLDNSDFFTGAFPAQYGNVISGVFDLRLRPGNNEHNEFWAGFGWNGLEIGSEGPVTKKSKVTYLISYRYSLLDVLSFLGVNLSVVPKYQDLNLKVNIPLGKAGQLSLTGMGGLSYIQFLDSQEPQSEWLFPDYGEDLSTGSNIGVIGLSHTIYPDPDLRLKNLIYLVGSKVYTHIDTFSNTAPLPSPWAGENSEEVKISYISQIKKKFNSRNTIESGVNFDYFFLSYADSIIQKSVFVHQTGSREQTSLLRGYFQLMHNFSNQLRVTTGLFGSTYFLNNSWALEPRLGFEWMINTKHSVNFGAGLYSQMQPKVIYFLLSHQPDGTVLKPNLNLDYSRNVQAAIGYNYLLSQNLRFKTEAYYQYLYDLPVKESIPQYSLSNQGHEFFLDRQYSDSLINQGTGQNFGIEFTFERFLKKNYYFLLTSSFFHSTYNGFNKEHRNSAFAVNYALNAVGGYEFAFGKRKWAVMSFGVRATWTGGNPYIPYDVAATVSSGEPEMDWTQAYEVRYPEYKRISVRFGIKRNLPKYNFEFLLDLQYRTNYTNVYLQRIDPKTGEIKDFFNMGFFPMATWRMQF